MIREHRFHDPAALAEALATSIADDLTTAVERRGTAALVVSGGSTPRPLFRALAHLAVPWSRVAITLADERWVAPEDEASNEALVRRDLLVGKTAAARFVALKNDAPTPRDGLEICERALAALPRPFDVVVLGMGADGHTASLFPGAPGLAAALDPASSRLCAAIEPPAAPHPRLSLTLAALLDARRIVLHLVGDEKWRVYREARGRDGSEETLPIRAVLRRAARVDVYWAP